jgi:hypothetical protein
VSCLDAVSAPMRSTISCAVAIAVPTPSLNRIVKVEQGGIKTLGARVGTGSLGKHFLPQYFPRLYFFCTSSPSKLVREGVVASLGKEQTADRLHIHSGIFSCSLVF